MGLTSGRMPADEVDSPEEPAMDSRLETRIAELEATVLALQLRLEKEDARRRRAGAVRLGGLLILGVAYVIMFQQATSLFG